MKTTEMKQYNDMREMLRCIEDAFWNRPVINAYMQFAFSWIVHMAVQQETITKWIYIYIGVQDRW